ncbi:hypothetical protein ACFVYD_19685 [Streptomyces sp. NPDC058301]|uniref:hypothetical protein n=1 Tax=Streptomyces sp. NPDC058301 TaxID=3346436 RepID=UPI0036E912CC
MLRAFYEPSDDDLSCEVLAPGEVALKHVESDQLETPRQAVAHDGLHVNSIHVDTPQARTTHEALLHTLIRTVTAASC